MKSVLLLGDSIRLGYERYVAAMLDGVANVYTPGDVNNGMAQFILRWVHEWKRRCNFPDDLQLVHWNAGLWDVLRILDDDTLSSPEFYKDTLRRISQRLRLLFPNAKQVFALSTWVQEDLYKGEYKRFNRDIELFNKIAVETLTPLGVEFNDLYTVAKTAPKECWSDLTHFNTVDGIRRIGGAVVDCICGQLEIDRASLADKEAELFEIPEKLLGY